MSLGSLSNSMEALGPEKNQGEEWRLERLAGARSQGVQAAGGGRVEYWRVLCLFQSPWEQNAQ